MISALIFFATLTENAVLPLAVGPMIVKIRFKKLIN